MSARVAARMLFCLATLASLMLAEDPHVRLDFAGSPQMLACDPVSPAPCFRMQLNVVDGQGHPAGVPFPPPSKLADSMRINVDDEEVTPFFAAAQEGSSAAKKRLAMVLIDISGSMNRRLSTGGTRFDAARSALHDFLGQFQDGSDEIAVAPFESHHVAETIRGARFASTRADALAAAAALPAPGPKNNTALYSAVFWSLNVLAARSKEVAAQTGKPPDALLVVMTDGTNEILRGDDAGLLSGPAGLAQVSREVGQSGVQVIGIGFGNPSEIDEPALRALSTKYFMARDYEELRRIFAMARTLLTDRLTATISSPWPDRASLAGRTLHVTASLALPSGQTVRSPTQIWSAPAMGLPIYEGRCSAVEMKALLEKTATGANAWTSILRPILVFIGLSALMLALWFWAPRLVWPEQYIGEVPGTGRWLGPRSGKAAKSGSELTGFGTASQSPEALNRTPSEGTVVQRDFTRTRLERYRRD